MGAPPTPSAVLDGLDAPGLERLFRERQAEYDVKFKAAR